MADVFISYKKERRKAAEHLAKILERYGYTVWFDYQLVKGRDFAKQLDAKVREAKAVVVLWCSMSVRSEWVANEAAVAAKLDTLVPVKIEPCELRLDFDHKDYIDLTSWDGSPRHHALDGVLDALERKIGRTPQLNFKSMREYEEDWRRFGAPSLRKFALDAPGKKRSKQKNTHQASVLPSKDFTRERIVCTSYKLRDVFGIHLSKVTEVDRSGTPGYKQFADALSQPGCLLRLYGPSKSGKTVLCQQVLRKEGFDPILLHGVDIDTLRKWWLNIAFEAGDSLGITNDAITDAEEIKIIKYCRSVKRPIVIDDFHAIGKSTRTAIIRRIKGLVDFGVTVVTISVADVVADILEEDDQIRKDLYQRTMAIPAPLWSPGELEAIAVKGFTALNVKISPGILSIISHNAYRNPLLMQQYCLQLCQDNDIRETQKMTLELSLTAEDLQEVFVSVAKRDAGRFDRIWQDNSDSKFPLRCGTEAPLKALILMSIATVAISIPVNMSTITKRIPSYLASDIAPPTRIVITDAAKKLVEKAKSVLGKDLSIDIIDGRMHVLHPFFKVYLLWHMLPAFGLPYPDIKKYMDEEIGETGRA